MYIISSIFHKTEENDVVIMMIIDYKFEWKMELIIYIIV